MSAKRPLKKGSFGSHFDELVKHFPHERLMEKDGEEKDDPSRRGRDVHDLLFERAWRHAREGHNPH